MNIRLLAGVVVLVLSVVGVIHADSYAAESVRWDDVTGATATSGFSLEPERKSWHFGNCREEQGEVEGYSPKISTTLCVVRSVNFAFASYSDGGTQRYAAKLASDTVFHLVDNAYLPANPVLLADDTLLTLNFAAGPPQLVSVGAVHTKLIEKQIQSGPDTFRKVYAIDTSQGVAVTDASDYPLFTSAVAVSANGHYAAAAVYGSGIVHIDLQTKKAKLITNNKVSSQSQNIQLAVSDDGSHVVVSDQDLGKSSIYMVSDGCGRSDFHADPKINQPCPSIDFSTELSNAMDKQSAYRAVIGADDTINFYYWDASQSLGRVVVVKPDTDRQRLQYLALGDSYSSGEGDTEKTSSGGKYYRDFTDKEEDTVARTPREKCHISTRSYPYLLASDMGLGSPLASPSTKWQSVACSGAQVYDIANSRGGYLGQGWGGKDPGRPRLQGYVDAAHLQSQALSDFIPGRVQQIEFVKKYRPRVITVTMGGNDVGFADKIENCAMSITLCEFAQVENRRKLKNELSIEYVDLVRSYRALYDASAGQSKIYVLGYPQFINPDVSASCKSTFNLDYNERVMVYNSVEYFNNVIEQAANTVGVKYVDIESALGRHRLCDSGEKYVTAITNILGLKGNEAQESFHPNSQGHSLISSAIKSSLGNQSLIAYNACQAPIVSPRLCPRSDSTLETIQGLSNGYFDQGVPTQSQMKKQNMVASEVKKGGIIDIGFGPGLGRPGSGFTAVLHSDPVQLGTLTVDPTGALMGTVPIPASVPAGYHTLILAGENANGEPIEYYQSVLVVGTDASDIDEDGVLDIQEACGPFIVASRQDTDKDGVDDSCDLIVPEVLGGGTTDPTTPTIPTTPTTPPTSPQTNLIQQFVSRIVSVVKSIIKAVQQLLGKFF